MSLRDRLDDAVARAAMVEQELLDPRTVRDAKLLASLGKEHQRLQDVVRLAAELRQAEREQRAWQKWRKDRRSERRGW